MTSFIYKIIFTTFFCSLTLFLDVTLHHLMIIVSIFRCSLLLFLDVTPLKSPNPETEAPDLKALSSSSSVEVVPLDGSEDSQADHLQQYVQERMASLGLKPGRILNRNV